MNETQHPLLFAVVAYVVFVALAFSLWLFLADDPFVEFSDARLGDRPTLNEVWGEMRAHWANTLNQE